MSLKVNDIIQVTKSDNHNWIGCLLQVDEVKKWGCQAFMKTFNGNVYCRFNHDDFMLIGPAAVTWSYEEDENDDE